MLIVEVHNDRTGTWERGNYTYRVLVNSEVVAAGKLTNYERRLGWGKLVENVVQDHERQKLLVLAGATAAL